MPPSVQPFVPLLSNGNPCNGLAVIQSSSNRRSHRRGICTKALDGRKRTNHGARIRKGTFYARLAVVDPNASKIVLRVWGCLRPSSSKSPSRLIVFWQETRVAKRRIGNSRFEYHWPVEYQSIPISRKRSRNSDSSHTWTRRASTLTAIRFPSGLTASGNVPVGRGSNSSRVSAS